MNLTPAESMGDEDLLRHAKIRYPNIAFKRGDKPKSFFFNIIYSLIWLALVLAVSATGYLFVNPYCGFGAILSLVILKGLLDALMGNTVLVHDKSGSLVYRKTKAKTKRDFAVQKKMIQKLSALDKDEEEQKLQSLITDILSDEENNQDKVLAIASMLIMDKNKDGQLSVEEMLDTTYNELQSSFGLEADETAIKAGEDLASQILLYLDSNPDATSKNIVEKFSKEDKYDPFS